MQTKHLCALIHIWTKDEVGTVKQVEALQLNIFTDRSKAVLLLWIICVIYVLYFSCFRVHLFIATLWSPAGKGLISWLLFVMFIVFLLLSLVVSWVRCGTWLYRFLIFGVFLSLENLENIIWYLENPESVIWHSTFLHIYAFVSNFLVSGAFLLWVW